MVVYDLSELHKICPGYDLRTQKCIHTEEVCPYIEVNPEVEVKEAIRGCGSRKWLLEILNGRENKKGLEQL